MGEASNPRSPAESSCLGTGINPETGAGIGDSVYATESVADAVIGTWSMPATDVLTGEILKDTRQLQWNVGEKDFSYSPCRVIRACNLFDRRRCWCSWQLKNRRQLSFESSSDIADIAYAIGFRLPFARHDDNQERKSLPNWEEHPKGHYLMLRYVHTGSCVARR